MPILSVMMSKASPGRAVIGLLILIVGFVFLLRTPPLESAGTSSEWPQWAIALNADLSQQSRQLLEARPRLSDQVTVHARDAGLVADGIVDVTTALQKLIDDLIHGGTIILDPGVYRHTRCITVNRDNVRIIGRDATLKATNANDSCFFVRGANFELEGVRFVANAQKRSSDLRRGRIVVKGPGAVLRRNTIEGSGGTGIFIAGAQRFLLIENHVSGTKADGIHVTGASSDGYIVRNVVEGTGDDGIAVVSYAGAGSAHRILVEGNAVSNVKFARGISIVGSSNIVVRENSVSGTGRAAGILIAREEAWRTPGVRKVIVTGNRVSDVARRFSYPFSEMTGHGAIELNSDGGKREALAVKMVVVSDNLIINARNDGIRLLGAVCHVTLSNNSVRDVGGTPINLSGSRCTTAPTTAPKG